jgi:hypothetical protein
MFPGCSYHLTPSTKVTFAWTDCQQEAFEMIRVAKMLCIVINFNPLQNASNIAELVVDNSIAVTSLQEMCNTTVPSILGNPPSALLFHPYILLDISILPNFKSIQAKYQALVNEDSEDKPKIKGSFSITSMLKILPSKLEDRAYYDDPFGSILDTQTKETITIQTMPPSQETMHSYWI